MHANSFFSNRIESLYQELKQGLFSKSHLFTKKIVLVSSPFMKSWLMMQMANDPDLQIAMGVEVGYIDQFVFSLLELPYNFPTEMEVALALESEIRTLIACFSSLDETEKACWYPLINFLQASSPRLSRKSQKRLISLSKTLASLFMAYGKYGFAMIEEWNSKPNQEWQEQLWLRIERFFSPWGYPARVLGDDCKIKILSSDLQIHVFAMSYVAPVHFRFLMKVSEQVSLRYYSLSPCKEFWSDIMSDREASRLKSYWQKKGISHKQQMALDELLRDANPLLANFGRLGREMALQVEESSIEVHEKYSLPSSIYHHPHYQDLSLEGLHFDDSKTDLTLLEAIQADLTLLRSSRNEEKISFSQDDQTIQVHVAPSPMREVQIIYDLILNIIQKHSNDEVPIQPSDVLVMAPKIMSYEPFIKSIFCNSESPLDAQIMDLNSPLCSPLVQAFLHLLQMPFGRWDAASLLRLFSYRSFQKKHQLSNDDIQQIHTWIKLLGIRWGSDVSHRNEMLKRDHCRNLLDKDSWSGTWDYGLGRLLEKLALSEDESNSYAPQEGIDYNQGTLLGKIIHLLDSLKQDLKVLHESTNLTLREWSVYLKCLFESYFSSDTQEEQKQLMQHFEIFEKASFLCEETKFSFLSIQDHLISALDAKSLHFRETHLQAVKFCSLLPMRAIPAKVILLMGMDETAFPRQEVKLGLNLMAGNPRVDYCPSQIDFDRYIFLECLLSARQYLFISYVGSVTTDSKMQSPSILVSELLTYMDEAYSIGHNTVSSSVVKVHPFQAFDRKYFEENSSLKSSSQSNYLNALAFSQKKKNPPHSLISDFIPSGKVSDKNSLVIDLRDLAAFARNPLKAYFNKTLGIYLESEEDRIIKNDELLHLPKYENAILLREALTKPLKPLMKSAKAVGRFPQGPFEEVFTKKITFDVDEIRSNLEKMDVNPEEFWEIKLSEHCIAPHLTSNCWEFPPLKIRHPSLEEIQVVGKLTQVSSQGLVVYGGNELKDAVKDMPNFLVFSCLKRLYNLSVADQVIFAKKSKILDLSTKSSEDQLEKYVAYYLSSMDNPSPLLPDLLSDFIDGNAESLLKKMTDQEENARSAFFNDYLKWLLRGSKIPETRSLVENWQAIARQVYSDLYQSWSPKKSQKAGLENIDAKL